MSEDVRSILVFELGHGNEVLNVGSANGHCFFELRLPFHVSEPGFESLLIDTVQPWHWGSQHYEEQYDGLRSVTSGDAVVVRRRKGG